MLICFQMFSMCLVKQEQANCKRKSKLRKGFMELEMSEVCSMRFTTLRTEKGNTKRRSFHCGSN